MTDVARRLRDRAEDPMWADHAEVRKALLFEAAQDLEWKTSRMEFMQDRLTAKSEEIIMLRRMLRLARERVEFLGLEELFDMEQLQ